ncbi:MAG: Class SAM-dependent methyltransferase [Thermoleophilia bacterium]|nr:Class SAM-dependent methyltransferase [Thermoleophilia bacterium]
MALSDDYATRNRDLWTQTNDEYTGEHAARAWARDEITWGIFGIPERELAVLGDVAGLDVIELGCGTAYFSAWLAKRGARPVGVDVTPAQLETARRCQREFGLDFPLIEANAEEVSLPDASFDLAVSEYGASLWCDPYKWVPEAARLLRPGGRLVFLTNSMLVTLTVPEGEGYATETLLRPQKGMHRVEWADQDGVEFHIGHGEWIRVLRDSGFAVEGLTELYAPEGAKTHPYYDVATADWARKWPAEDMWVARNVEENPLV